MDNSIDVLGKSIIPSKIMWEIKITHVTLIQKYLKVVKIKCKNKKFNNRTFSDNDLKPVGAIL